MNILYKYRTNSEQTEKIFTGKKIWLSNARRLNDPFECSIQEISKEWAEKQNKEGMQAHVVGFVMGAMRSIETKTYFFGLPPEGTQLLLGQIKSVNNIEDAHKIYREFTKTRTGHYPTDMKDVIDKFDQQLNNVGIFSMSETAENQLMWSHYANESKGITIGFEMSEGSKLSDKAHCLQVNYSDELPAFNQEGFITETSLCYDDRLMPYFIKKISFNDPTFKLAVTTKSTCWQYEKEWRYIEETSGAFPFPGPIKEIVFGLFCTTEDRKKYRDLADSCLEGNISYFEIQKKPNSNSIIRVPL